MKGLLGLPKGEVLEDLLGLPSTRFLGPVPETLPYTDAELWYDAADNSTITIATGVSSWANKGSSGVAATQATGSAQPVYGIRKFGDRYVIDFNGTSHRLNATFGVNDRICTWFYVAQLDNGNTGSVVGTQSNSGDQILHSGTTIAIYDRFQGGADATMPNIFAEPNQPFVYGHQIDGGALTVRGRLNYLTSSAALNAATPASQSGNLALMFSHVGGQVPIKGAVAEVIKYDRVLSDDEFDMVFQYLGKKWNIQVNN